MTSSSESPTTPTIREMITVALRYWEPRRLIYNVVLGAIVIWYFAIGQSPFGPKITFNGVLGLFLMAVLANAVYCAAYIVDIFVQLSGFRAVWGRYRWVLFLLGLAFASTLTYFFAGGLSGD